MPEESELLRAARSALEPTAAARSRVLASTLAASARGAAPKFFVEESAAAAGGAGAAFLRRAVPYVAGAFLLGGVGGYFAGHSAGLRASVAPPLPVVASAALPSGPQAPAEPVQLLPAEPGVGAVVTKAEPSREVRALSSAPPAAPSALSPEQSLEEELRALRRTERALREHNPLLARAVLAELDRTVPNGKLQEERAAAAAVAACQLEPSSARVEEFAAKFRSSVHFERVRQACSAIGDAGAAAERDSVDGR